MALTLSLADAQSQLTTVNAAIQTLISGQRVTQLRVGSGQFVREYKYQEITIESLRQIQSELLADVDYYTSLASPTLPNFSSNRTIPMMVRKDYFNVWAQNSTGSPY